VKQRDRTDRLVTLGAAHLNKGVCLSHLERLQAAIEQFDLALAIARRVLDHEDHWRYRTHLASACTNKAVVLAKLGDFAGALGLCRQAIAIYTEVVFQEGQVDWLSSLGRCRVNCAQYLFHLGRIYDADAEVRQTITMLKCQAVRTRRTDLARVMHEAVQVYSHIQGNK
jgi:tetratricopeptide (TPR) repeat protein